MATSVKNLYVIVARDASTDASDQMNSIMKIIERFTLGYSPDQLKTQGIALGEKPVLFPVKYALVTAWFFDKPLAKDTFINFKVGIRNPNGAVLDGPSQEHLVPAGIDRVNMNLNMEGLPATTSGRYALVVEMISKDGHKLAEGEYPFVVDLVEEAAPKEQ